MDKKFEELKHQQKKHQEKARKREGEVTIDYQPQKDLKNKPTTGEYVDYTEIKD